MKVLVENKEKIYGIMNRFSLLFQAAWCMILYFIMEAMSRHSVVETVEFVTGRPLVFLYNVLLIFMTMNLAYLFRRRTLIRLIVSLFWFLLGMVNSIILANRVTPFTGQDLTLLTDAQKIINNYMSPVQLALILIAIGIVIILLVWFGIKGHKYTGKRNIILDLLIVVVSVGLFIGSTVLGIQNRVISTYFGNVATAYEQYGLPYCFWVTLLDTGISEPDGYSKELVELVEEKNEEAGETDMDVQPNVIFLQLESFFDPTTVSFLDISEDPIPYFHELQENYSSGMLNVPVVGAGTVNTEFEVITGMSLDYFGAGEYPYKTILKEETCESIPYNLKELGYTTHAIHNNEANFYARRTVYSMLGFDTFTSEEYMADISDTTETGWVKDYILTDEILKALDSTTTPDYIYTVSVQAHGDYPTEEVISDPEITVTGAENRDKNNASWEYYLEQIHEMDEFLEELTAALEEYDEPTVLVIFGDHLPTMGLEAREVTGGDLYRTPYVIWDNMGLEKEDKVLTSYQLGAEVMDRIDMHTGTLVRFHQARSTTRYYKADLELLQYDMLYGEKYVYGGESPYLKTDIVLGTEPVTLESVDISSSGTVIVTGENFTASSKIEINGELMEDTIFVDNETLMLRDTEMRLYDTISVAQQSNSSTHKVLSRTDTYRAIQLRAN